MFSIKMKEFREKNNMLQKDLSKFLNIPLQSIKNWESNVKEPTVYTQKLILQKLKNYNKK